MSLRGRHYDKIVVNQLWATVDPAISGVRYVGPREILEGRALALCLSYLSHILNDCGGAQSPLLRYVQHYYSKAPHYKIAVAIESGKSLEKLCGEGEPSLPIALQETIVATWYALHSPPVVAEEDVQMALPFRFLMACRALQDNDLAQFSSPVSFLNSLDDTLAGRLSFKPAKELLKQSIWHLQIALDEARECTNETLREWFHTMLLAIRNAHAERAEWGYGEPYGMPKNGNVLTGIDDTIFDAIASISHPPAEVAEWFALRALVLYGRGLPGETFQKLRQWFA